MRSDVAFTVSLDLSEEEVDLFLTVVEHYRSTAGSAGGSRMVGELSDGLRKLRQRIQLAKDVVSNREAVAEVPHLPDTTMILPGPHPGRVVLPGPPPSQVQVKEEGDE
jgi:hypothetical protein